MESWVRCSHCREPVGIYEPIVVLDDGEPVLTSRAAEPNRPLNEERCLHEDCFRELQGDAP